MSIKQISENVYSIGVLNPTLRIFDVIMKTDYGTSYNAYLIKNNGKSALVETVHAKFFDEYLENIKSILGDTPPDYLIMNHNEPDHSGSVAKLTEIYPDIIIIESKAGAIYIKNIANKELNIKTVSDNEIFDFGGGELKFIVAPFLHWPDSMFTYFAKDKILFTCDFLGAHFCEPTAFDYNIKKEDYEAEYNGAFVYYYNAIFGPFKPYVLSGLDKIKDIDFETACPSHGPVLTKKDGGNLDCAIKAYAEMSAPHKNEATYIPIFYCTAYGNTGILAENIKTGIKEIIPGADVNIINLNMADSASAQLHLSDAFLIGSPTINRDAVAPVWELINTIDAVSMRDRPCAVFGSYGWSGEGCSNLIARLKGLKLKVSENPLRCQFVPSQDDLDAAIEYGREFAKSL
ncbi:MAG: FprA family A-type flavoprotein [Oscillospiraceae bacterium]|nr:FprA family A-type flavoprotein [Oscillospiraceae bacterium]